MQISLSRTATISNAGEVPSSVPLADLRDYPAYVLLGDPGSGKSTALKAEAAAVGGHYVDARDFVYLPLLPEMKDKTLFIDGLDEIRAGGENQRRPLDEIRSRLIELGSPRYRLSCREADWLGDIDRVRLQTVSPSATIVVAHLDALSDEQIALLLRSHGVADVDAFIEKATQHRLENLLHNPLLLRLLATAVNLGSSWPGSRKQTYALACENLVAEKNVEHASVNRGARTSTQEVLNDAGVICAVMLLSGASEIHAEGPQESRITHADLEGILSPAAVQRAISTNLFRSSGTSVGREPIHRTVAEYLGANALATRIANQGLSLRRVLALMSGRDGGVVQSLRGLHAWLAVHCATERDRLIDADPLGVVLYGDALDFFPANKARAFRALEKEAERFPWFRNEDWVSSPFGALATEDMVPTFKEILSSPDRSPRQNALIDCVLDALKHATPLTGLDSELLSIVGDKSLFAAVRKKALSVWLRYQPSNSEAPLQLLDTIADESIADDHHQLLGSLLAFLYPHRVGPIAALKYLKSTRSLGFSGSYQMFWDIDWVDKLPANKLAEVADYFAANRPFEKVTWRWDGEPHRIVGKLILRALEEHGDKASVSQLAAWLSSALDEHNFVRLEQAERQGIASWLASRGSLQQQLLWHVLTSVDPSSDYAIADLRMADQRLLLAKLPHGMARWYLEKATIATSELLAQHCLQEAVASLERHGSESGISLEDLEIWTGENTDRWPQARAWLETYLVCDLTKAWQAKDAHRTRDQQTKFDLRKSNWLKKYREHLPEIATGAANAHLMYELALAHKGLLVEAPGETPEERLNSFLDNDMELVQAAFSGLEKSLDRQDLPEVEEILKLDLQGRMHFIRPACLVGADLLTQRSVEAPLGWPVPLQRKMTAFWLADGTGDIPQWYRLLAQEVPDKVFDIFSAHVTQHLRKKPAYIAGLWQLAHEDAFAEIASLTIASIIKSFPIRASNEQLRHLPDVLVAGFKHLNSDELLDLTTRKLRAKSIDAGQRAQWLFVGTLLAPNKHAKQFVEVVRSSEQNAFQVGLLLRSRGFLLNWMKELDSPTISATIESIAIHSSPEWQERDGGWVTPKDELRDAVQTLISYLEASSDSSASDELARLIDVPVLKHWRTTLQGAQFKRRISVRNQTFKHADARSVVATLKDQRPASSADLSALVVDRLLDLNDHLRGSDAGDLKNFWRGEGALRKPRIENDCRDEVLRRIRGPLLLRSIDVAKEAAQWQETRVDMRALISIDGRQTAVPIEVKGEWNDELWTAATTQLSRYSRHPASSGYGIYVVLWFEGRVKASPSGQRPTTPADLQAMLEATLSDQQRRHTSIVVLDCSWQSES